MPADARTECADLRPSSRNGNVYMKRPPAALLALVALALLAAASARADETDGFHAEPSLYWKAGDSRIDLNVSSRYRLESWDAYAMDSDSFWGVRNRLKLTYTWREKLQLVGEVQD